MKAPRIRRSPEAARELILETARALIAERGPDAVGITDIGKAAGISHTLVVHYYGTYEALVQEVLRTGIARFREKLIERVASAPELDPIGMVGAVLDELNDRTPMRLVLWALLSGRLEGPDAFFRQEQGFKRVADAVEARVGDTPTRAVIETTLVLGAAASWGYAIAAPMLWGSLGREPSAARDQAVRDQLGRALWQSALAGAPKVDGSTTSKATSGPISGLGPRARRR